MTDFSVARFDTDELRERPFGELVAPLFEDAPRFIVRLEAGRPYGSWEALFGRAVQIALAMPVDEQVELIDAHPRIGAPPGSVSALSFVEQGYDYEEASAEAETERVRIHGELDRLNRDYEARFGFRYVIFVAGRPRAAIVALMEAMLHADGKAALETDRKAERERALRDVVAIARNRAIKTGLMTEDSQERIGIRRSIEEEETK